MRVLLLSQHYDPEPVPRSGEIARGLVAAGHQVTVLTAIPNYPRGRFYPGYPRRLWSSTVEDGVRVVRLPMLPDHSRSPLRRILNYVSFTAMAILLGPLLCGRVDAIHVLHPPLTIGLAATWIGWLRRAPFLYDVQDLWPESVVAVGMLKPGRIVDLLARVERFIYARATSIGVVSPAFVANLEAKGVPREKIHFLPGWADAELYYPEEPDPEEARRRGMEGRFHLLFAGNLGLAQGLDVLLDAAEELADQPDIRILVAGDGQERPRLEREIARRGLDNLRLLGAQPPAEIRRLSALSDALLIQLQAGFFAAHSIPVKVYSYLACGRPIVAALEGPTRELVASIGAGPTCEPGDPALLAATIRRLRDMPPKTRAAMGRRAARAFEGAYSQRQGVARCERRLQEIAGVSPSWAAAPRRTA